MKNWIIIIVAAFLFFSGCQKEDSILPMEEYALKTSTENQTVPIGEEIILHVGQTVMVVPDGFRITFSTVSEDSRCPTGVNCIWEGRAVIKLVVENRENTYEVLLETPNSQETTGPAINLFGRTIKLLQVAPYPEADHQITTKEYRIVLLVDELETIGEDK
ncbi:MAG: hypothetical protein R2788_26585 [Saprospiraceae bacterium]